MKKLIRPLLLGLGLLLPATPVLAASEVSHFSFNGQIAIAAFQSVDSSGCIQTNVGVIAVDGSIKVDGQPPVASETSVTIEVNDTCSEVTLVAASGSTRLAGADFVMRKLDTATLDGSIEVSDKTSGMTFVVELNVTWTGFGDPTRTKNHVVIASPGFVLNSQSDGTSRGATASGTVSAGTTNFTPDAAVEASLSDARSGDVSVVRL